MSALVEKPRLRRSMDYAYEEIREMWEEMLGEPDSMFNIGNDPHFDESASLPEDPPECNIDPSRVSVRQSFSGFEGLVSSDLFGHKEAELNVLAMISSDEEEEEDSTKHVELLVSDDAKECRAIVVRTNSSNFRRVYSTDKPHNFSLQASPVKKEQDTLNSLDCSALVDVIKSIDVDKSAAQDSIAESKKWTIFDEPFELHNGPESTEVSLSPRAQEETAAAFAPSVFVDLDKSDISNVDDREDLVRQVEELTGRLASLERIVQDMEHVASPAEVSKSEHTEESLGDRAQDVAFILENSELSASTVDEENTCTTIPSAEMKQSKGKKFSVVRMFRSHYFGKQSERKASRAEV